MREHRDNKPLVRSSSRISARQDLTVQAAEQERRYFALSEVQQRIRHYLSPALKAPPFWVKGELADVSCNKHLFCSLVETREGRQLAKLRCHAWSDKVRLIRRRFHEYGLQLELESGTLVGLFCNLQHTDLYGLALNIIDIDPGVTLGELERRRREILQKLKREGLLDRNKELPEPKLPQRIGLITPAQAASYHDFVRTLSSSTFGFHIRHASAVFQGAEAESSIIRGLKKLQSADLDLIVIVRGGGSKTDLAYLDNEHIARTIADSRLPVWTAIGHETDTSVLDEIAARSFRTPSAVAEKIVALSQQASWALEKAKSRLINSTNLRLKPSLENLRVAKDRLIRGSHRRLERGQDDVARMTETFHRATSSRVTHGRESLLRAQDALSRAGRRRLEQQTDFLSHSRLNFSHKTFGVLSNWRQRVDQWRVQLRRETDHTLETTRASLRHQQDFFTNSIRQLLSAQRTITQQARARLKPGRVQSIVLGYQDALETLGSELERRTMAALERADTDLKRSTARFRIDRFIGRIEQHRSQLDSWKLAIRSADPQNILARGFAIVLDDNDQIIMTVEDIDQGEPLGIRLKDGKIRVRTEGIEQHDA